MSNFRQIIQQLELIPHQEGGYFKEIYKADLKMDCTETHGGERHAYTTIYYLLAGHDFSAWHKVASDETWYFHAGCSLEIFWLDSVGELNRHQLGAEHLSFQWTIKANTWFCAKPADEASYTLVSCSVAPGFDYRDFTLATSTALIAQYPEHEVMIRRYIRDEV